MTSLDRVFSLSPVCSRYWLHFSATTWSLTTTKAREEHAAVLLSLSKRIADRVQYDLGTDREAVTSALALETYSALNRAEADNG